MYSYIITTRNKESGKGTFGDDVGPITYLAVPEGESVPLQKHKVGGVSQWMDAVVKQAKPNGTKPGDELDIVFFVHGYNTPADEALKRQRLVEAKLRKRGFDCMVVGYDWPTEGSAALYLVDRFNAQKAAADLVRGGLIPFTKFNLPDCPVNVHLMAHSMGSFVVRESFRALDLARDASLSNDWRIGQIVLFAADLSSECFALNSPDMLPVFRHCGRLTNYFSGHDEALAASNVKNLDISSRVGRVGMPMVLPVAAKAVDVDCGPRYIAVPDRKFAIINGMKSHSWYLEDEVWYDDLAFTLSGAIDRNSIPTRKPALGSQVGDNDFVLNVA